MECRETEALKLCGDCSSFDREKLMPDGMSDCKITGTPSFAEDSARNCPFFYPNPRVLKNKEAHELKASYSVTKRIIALYLKEFCDRALPYNDMIREAVRKAALEIDNLRRK